MLPACLESVCTQGTTRQTATLLHMRAGLTASCDTAILIPQHRTCWHLPWTAAQLCTCTSPGKQPRAGTHVATHTHTQTHDRLFVRVLWLGQVHPMPPLALLCACMEQHDPSTPLERADSNNLPLTQQPCLVNGAGHHVTGRAAHRQLALVLQHEHRLHGARCRACWLAGQGAKPSTGLTTASQAQVQHIWLVTSTNRHSRIPWWWMASSQHRWQSASMRLTDSGNSKRKASTSHDKRCSYYNASKHPAIFCCAVPGGPHPPPVMHKHNTHPTTAATCSVPTKQTDVTTKQAPAYPPWPVRPVKSMRQM